MARFRFGRRRRYLFRGFWGPLFLAPVGGGLIDRLATEYEGNEPLRLHVDPTDVRLSCKPNEFLAAPPVRTRAPPHETTELHDETPEMLLERFNFQVRLQPCVESIAVSLAENLITYVQRSPLPRNPAYISVTAVTVGDRAGLAIYTRSLYFVDQTKIHRARVRRWLALLETPA